MPKMLTRLRIDEVSSVDRGAGEGVKIMLMKRNKDKVMPETKLSKMFSKLFGGQTEDNSVVIDKSVEGLAESISSILADDKIDDPAEALTKTFEQFSDHLKETLTAGPAVIKKEGSDMDLTILKKALGLADTASEADVTKALADQQAAIVAANAGLKKMERELRVSKAEFTPAELDFYNKAADGDDDDGDDPKLKAKKAFRVASHPERATIMKTAEPALPSHIQKILEDSEKMAKRIAELEAGGSLVALTKQATDAGLAESEGVTIQNALKGDKAAIEKLLGFVKSAIETAKVGGVFKEFGSSSGTGVVTSAYDELAAKAKELQKADSKLSFSQAFAKVYEDPNNIEIVKKERADNRPAVA